jgi:hypothetical protein
VGWLLALWFLAVAMFVQKLYCERDWEETERQLSLKASELRSDLEVFEESLKFLRHGLDQLLVARSKYWHKEDLELEISRRKSDLERLDIQINALDRRLESLRSQQQLGLWTSWEGWEKYSGRLVFSYIAIAFIYVLWLDDSHRGDPGGVTWLRGIFAIPLLLNIAWVVFFIQRKIHERSSGWSYSALKEEERELLDEVEPLRDERRPAIYRPLNLLECELRCRAIAR